MTTKPEQFKDGAQSLVSSLVNSRSVTSQNVIVSQALDFDTLRNVYRHGVMNKIIRLKAGHALKDTLQFESKEDELFYDARLSKIVKRSAKWMLAFGRGIVVIHAKGDDLSKPIGATLDNNNIKLDVFSGDMVTVGDIDRDLSSPRYYKPIMFNVRGIPIHWSRVVEFNYVEAPELDAPKYMYGGISETELIYEQLIADGIVQRASPKIIEKAATKYYKVDGFKDAMRTGNEADMVNYFTRMESLVGIYSAGLVDKTDEIEVVQQNISNLADADQITLRRLAMVCGIPLAMLVGENVKGLGSTGDSERASFQDMIEALQSDYLLDPINHLMRKLGQGVVSFKENQGETPTDRMEYEAKAIDNALKLWQMGEDYRLYLEDKDVLQKDDYASMFEGWAPPEQGALPGPADGDAPEDSTSVDPASALNGAQVTALMEVISKLRAGEMSRGTAVKVIMTSFPVSESEAIDLISEVPEGG